MANEAGFLTDVFGLPIGTVANPVVTTGSGAAPSVVRIEDGSSGQLATVNAKGELSTIGPTGTWSYYAGTSGTVTVTAGQRVIGISCLAGTSAGTLTIAGGPSIPVPPGVPVNVNPNAQLTAPTIVFTNTVLYIVEVLS